MRRCHSWRQRRCQVVDVQCVLYDVIWWWICLMSARANTSRLLTVHGGGLATECTCHSLPLFCLLSSRVLSSSIYIHLKSYHIIINIAISNWIAGRMCWINGTGYSDFLRGEVSKNKYTPIYPHWLASNHSPIAWTWSPTVDHSNKLSRSAEIGPTSLENHFIILELITECD